MPGIKEIRNKIKSAQNTRKITKAMEMVAASKMRKAQESMHCGRPYFKKIREIATCLAKTNVNYTHSYLVKRPIRKVGIILVTTDKGLCGSLNTNIIKLALTKSQDFEQRNIKVQWTAIGKKGLGTLTRVGANLISQKIFLGDQPKLEPLLGAVKIQLDNYKNGSLDAIYVAYARFLNTMQQEPAFLSLLPIPLNFSDSPDAISKNVDNYKTVSPRLPEYVYEPDAKTVIDLLLQRYIEHLVYQAVAENMASEQSSRMVAMKSASDNAEELIRDLRLVYNKTRQAIITKEISEIVSGSA